MIPEVIQEAVMQQSTKKVDFGAGHTCAVNLHPNWHEFIRQCEKMGYGEIYRIKIQDGLPMAAEVIKKSIRFSKNGTGAAS